DCPMHVGMALVFQNPDDLRDDREVYDAELALGLKAESLGFQSLWTVDHHFSGYSMSPDPLQILTWFAGQTQDLLLGTAVIVLPWHDPLRVAEQVTLLDNMSGGRLLLGIGRGLARLEYEGFRVDRSTSRERFIEYADALLTGLEEGGLHYEGEFLNQPHRDLRPAPQRSFVGRTWAAAVSPESAPIMARLGAGLLVIPQKPWEVVAADVAAYEKTWAAEHPHKPPPPPLSGGFVFVDESADRAAELAHKYIGNYYRSILEHYELATRSNFDVRGYEFYSNVADHVENRGLDGAAEDFISLMPWGTPDQVIEKVAAIEANIGIAGFFPFFSYGGMPYDEVSRNVDLFVDAVMPELKSWDVAPMFNPVG
ncbi:MAG: LLM class flavin-dependent oxidoreductase, partial [Actinomycetota bacterium]|nr:LLM class flavin-dependent oxidoreductase [Actinomycetota bacterium]